LRPANEFSEAALSELDQFSAAWFGQRPLTVLTRGRPGTCYRDEPLEPVYLVA
jgi:hypothetical protein